MRNRGSLCVGCGWVIFGPESQGIEGGRGVDDVKAPVLANQGRENLMLEGFKNKTAAIIWERVRRERGRLSRTGKTKRL